MTVRRVGRIVRGMDRLDEIMAEVRTTQDRIASLVAAGPRPLVFPCRHGGRVAVSEDARRRGKWRATHVNADGEPTGHTEAEDFHESLKAAHHRGAVL